MEKLQIALIEPFFTGSHQKWSEGLRKHSFHNIKIFSLPGRFWKWRMHGGAISLAKEVLDSNQKFDVFLVSDFINLSLFKSLLGENYYHAKFHIYFHENQLTYPWSPNDQDVKLNRDENYSFINYSSALIADKVLFNSKFHLDSFLESLPEFLRQFPDENNFWTIDIIKNKSIVLSLAIELPELESGIQKSPNSILWNHRWEYDKNPEAFFKILSNIKEKKIQFKLIVLGEKTGKYPKVFDWAKDYFKDEIIHFGYVSSKKEYWNLLQRSSILPVTSNQDFFGISIVEAMYSGVIPLLPNRLVYPEHIPEENQERYLYNSEQHLESMLMGFLKNMEYASNFRKWVSKYSWEKSIENYDFHLNN